MDGTDGTTDGRAMTWEEFNGRSGEVVGKDIESELENGTFRGPIQSIGFDMKKGVAVLVLQWLATFNPTSCPTGEWEVVAPPGDGSPATLILLPFSEWWLADIGDGMIRLVDRYFNRHIIFVGGRQLPLNEVKNPNRN